PRDDADTAKTVASAPKAVPVKSAASATVPAVKSGWYTIKSTINPAFGLYIKGMSTKDGAKIQLKRGIVSEGFAFKLKKVKKYYQIIVGIAKNKSVEVIGIKNGSGGVVSISSKPTRKTLFKLKYDRKLDGFRLVNIATKQALCVAGGKAKSGAKIRGAKVRVGSKAQTFKLISRPGLIMTNIYSIKSTQKGKRALTADGKKGIFKRYGKTLNQKWYVAPVAGKKNVYIIESIATGKRLAGIADKRAKVLKASAGDKKQWWQPSFGGLGIVWKNAATKKPLSTAGDTCEEGSAAYNKKRADTRSQQFVLKNRVPVESGVYELKSSANTLLELGTKNESKKANAAVQVTEVESSASQKWIYNAKKHTLENAFSGMVLDARKAEAGTTVVQASPTGARTQKWSFTYVGGGNFQLISDSNNRLAISACGKTHGSATAIKPNAKAKTQEWRVVQSGYMVEPKGFNLIEDIVNWGHGPLNASYIVIHETANPGATAWNHRMLWSGDNYYADYAVHYVLDWTGNCYYCVPEDRLCWQVGNGNEYVIGIELCHATNKADFKKVWDAGVQWTAWQLKKHGWGMSRLISHNECGYKWGGTDHTDPDDYFESFGKTWQGFKAAVKLALARY
ncbi:MAG: RICIN domain-containing protein, partial [Coriobacteriia bacterium]|nr:RICIN domain-containing protein [Coriobacteriia bacterium]